MEDAKAPDPRQERIARAAERLRVASERASQAQEQLALAIERLAQARRALREARAREPREPAADGDSVGPGETP